MRTIASLPLLLVVLAPNWSAAASQPLDTDQIRVLIEKLDDDRYDVRERAERELRKQPASLVPVLEQAAEKADSMEVRWRLGRVLEVVGGMERKVRMLLRQLTHESYSKREQADQELRKLGPKALPLLKKEIAVVRDAEATRRLQRIVNHLMGDDLAVPTPAKLTK
jgi:hypothetical protein